jgi:hypothetical protein
MSAAMLNIAAMFGLEIVDQHTLQHEDDVRASAVARFGVQPVWVCSISAGHKLRRLAVVSGEKVISVAACDAQGAVGWWLPAAEFAVI